MLKTLVKDTAIYGLADFVFRFISFATFPIFTHALTVDQFGIFALVTTLSSLIGIVFSCGLNNAVQRLYLDPKTTPEQRPQIVSTGLWCLLMNAVFLCLGVLLFAYIDIGIFLSHGITLPMVMAGLVISIGLQVNVFCMDVIRSDFQPWKFTFLNLLQNALLVGLSLLFVFSLDLGVEGYLWGTALAYVLTTPFCLLMINRQLVPVFDIKLAKGMVHFGYPFIFAGFAYWMFGSMDRWMLGSLSTNEEVGLYSIAFKTATLLIFLNAAFSQAWSPQALRAYREDISYRVSFSQFLTIWFFVLIVFSTVVNLFSQELLLMLTPKDYWSASKLLPFIGISLAFFGTNQILGTGIALENKTFHFSIASWIAAGANFALNLLLIPLYGAQGAAFATLCSSVLLWVYYLVCCQKLHPLPLEGIKLLMCIILAVVSVCFNLWLNSFAWSAVVFSSKITFVVALLAVGFGLKILDFQRLWELFGRKKDPQGIEAAEKMLEETNP